MFGQDFTGTYYQTYPASGHVVQTNLCITKDSVLFHFSGHLISGRLNGTYHLENNDMISLEYQEQLNEMDSLTYLIAPKTLKYKNDKLYYYDNGIKKRRSLFNNSWEAIFFGLTQKKYKAYLIRNEEESCR